MFSLSNRVESAITLNPLAPTRSSSESSAKSFGKQLATALEGSHDESKGGLSHDIKVSEDPGQKSGGSQFLVRLTPERAPATATGNGTSSSLIPTAPITPSSPTSGATAPGTMEQLFSGRQAPALASSSAAPSAAIAGPVTEADAYWAEQPPAVQALRNMPEGAAKDALALNLANQGYSIDNQIMVMGWDPQTTMMMRQDYGYSWVPSYGQAAITVAPGVTDPFADSTYDPSRPPAGALRVSTST
jgi:hypothetical protein